MESLLLEPNTNCFCLEDLAPPDTPNSPVDTEQRVWERALYSDHHPPLQPWSQKRRGILENAITTHLPRLAPKLIVDYGCYFGWGTKILRELWPDARIIAMDIANPPLVVVRDRVPNIDTKLTDPGKFSGTEQPPDLITMIDVVEHIRLKEFSSLLADFYDKASINTVLLTFGPCADFLVGKPIKTIIQKHIIEARHPSIKSVACIVEALQVAGWRALVAEQCVEAMSYAVTVAIKG